MKAVLKIELCSDTCTSSGVGSAGVVDRDFVFDDLGLPFIPGRRLKGLLKDAYVDVQPHKDVLRDQDVESLFGSAGAGAPSQIGVEDARLKGYTALRQWLLAARAGKRGTVFRQNVLASFALLRRQTALDRRTGAALADSLRITRALAAGNTFQALITYGDEKQREALEYAAKSLKQIGLSRTRGLGRVHCTLSEASLEIRGGNRGTPIIQDGRLQFRIRLNSPAIFPQAVGDPNTVSSRDYIPGSAVLGLFAQTWREKDGDFFRLFFGGETRFLSGYPVINNRRSIVIPQCVREAKSEEEAFYNVVEEWASLPLRRVPGWCEGSILRTGKAARTDISRRFSYHHQRSDDRRIGRAISGEQPAGSGSYGSASPGALFAYDAIEEGQEFEGAILGNDEDLRELADRFQEAEPAGLRLGRSRSAEYGGNLTWSWLDSSEEPGETRREIESWWSEADDPNTESESGWIVVTLLSPVSWFNEEGHPSPCFPWNQLAEALKSHSLTPKREFSRTRIYGGFLSHQLMPRQQVPCLDTGTVFVAKAEPAIKFSALREAEKRSYGVRIEEGFGRVAIDPLGHVKKNPELYRVRQPFPEGSVALSSEQADAYHLAERIFRYAILERAESLGRRKAAEDFVRHRRISPSQLARLLQIIAQNPISNVLTELQHLKDTSRKGLGIAYNSLVHLVTPPVKIFSDVHEQIYKGAEWSWDKVFKTSPLTEKVDQDAVCRRYLFSYIRTLMELTRTGR